MRWVIQLLRALLLALAITLVPSPAWSKDSAPQVLLVCQFGTVKSAVARELLIRRAAERNVPVQVQSRGITPEDHLSPELIAQLRSDRIDPRRLPIQQLSQADLDAADVIVTFDPLPPSLSSAKAQSWQDVPSMNSSYRDARRVLDRRIDALLDQLSLRR